jgi:hypothetical protein
MGHDVFISYSTKDKPTADAACATLESSGVRCWIAPRDILPGSDWGESIVDAIRGCRVMVLVFSSNANASPQIRREVERAVNKGVAIIPFRIEEVMPTRSLEYFISTPHWMDAMSPPLEKHLKKLAEVVRALLAKFDEARAPAAAAPPTPVHRAREWLETAVLHRLSEGVRRVSRSVPISRDREGEKRRLPAWALLLGAGILLLALVALLPKRTAQPAAPAAGRASDEQQVVEPPAVEQPSVAVVELQIPPTALPERSASKPVFAAPAAGAVAAPSKPAPGPIAAVFRCRRGAEFHVSPDDAIVYIDGRRIGKADDWDGVGGGRVYYFPGPGTYYARFSLRGYRTAWVKIVVSPRTSEEIVDVDTDLDEID